MYIDLVSMIIGIFIGCFSSCLGVVIYFFNKNHKKSNTTTTGNPFHGEKNNAWYYEESYTTTKKPKRNKQQSKDDKTDPSLGSVSLDYLARTCVEDCLQKYSLKELLQDSRCASIKEAVVVIADTTHLYIRAYAESVHYDNKSLLRALNNTSDDELNAIIHSKASMIVSKNKNLQREILSIIKPEPLEEIVPETEPTIDRGGYSNVNKKDMVDIFKETRFYDDRF